MPWRELHEVLVTTRHLAVRAEALRCLGSALHISSVGKFLLVRWIAISHLACGAAIEFCAFQMRLIPVVDTYSALYCMRF